MSGIERPADVLRRAADKMRADADWCGDPSGSFTRAVADWVESSASDATDAKQWADGTWHFVWCDSPAGITAALKVARAYLGESEAAS